MIIKLVNQSINELTVAALNLMIMYQLVIKTINSIKTIQNPKICSLLSGNRKILTINTIKELELGHVCLSIN